LQETLQEFGVTVGYEVLQLYSGLDGQETIRIVAPGLNDRDMKLVMKAESKRYQENYLSTVTAFPGVRDLFERIKSEGGRIALATDCKGLQLKHYRSLLDVNDLIDDIACGDNVDTGKPDPGLVALAIEKLGIDPAQAVMIGDTPYDAEAACNAGASSVGLLSGGFSRNALVEAGAFEVVANIEALQAVLAGAVPSPARDFGAKHFGAI
jgi:HAD superfamily hydrolase (TIGR01549 family)